MNATPRILALHTGGLGDLLVAAPALVALAEAGSGASVELWADPRYVGALDGCRAFTGLDAIDRPGMHTLHGPPPDPDEMSPESRALRDRLAACDSAVAFLGSPGGPLEQNLRAAGIASVVTVRPPRMTDTGAVPAREAIRAQLAASGLALGPMRRLELDPTRAAVEAVRNRLAEAIGEGTAIAVVQPGSGSTTKNWPADRFVALMRRLQSELGVAPVVLLGPAEVERDHRFVRDAESSGAAAVVHDLGIGEALALLKRAALYVGNDSGISHLAATTRTAGVVLFGPTCVTLWAPDSPRLRVVAADGPVDLITVDRVLAELASLRSGRGPSGTGSGGGQDGA